MTLRFRVRWPIDSAWPFDAAAAWRVVEEELSAMLLDIGLAVDEQEAIDAVLDADVTVALATSDDRRTYPQFREFVVAAIDTHEGSTGP